MSHNHVERLAARSRPSLASATALSTGHKVDGTGV